MATKQRPRSARPECQTCEGKSRGLEAEADYLKSTWGKENKTNLGLREDHLHANGLGKDGAGRNGTRNFWKKDNLKSANREAKKANGEQDGVETNEKAKDDKKKRTAHIMKKAAGVGVTLVQIAMGIFNIVSLVGA